jgi:hypothetical protein
MIGEQIGLPPNRPHLRNDRRGMGRWEHEGIREGRRESVRRSGYRLVAHIGVQKVCQSKHSGLSGEHSTGG